MSGEQLDTAQENWARRFSADRIGSVRSLPVETASLSGNKRRSVLNSTGKASGLQPWPQLATAHLAWPNNMREGNEKQADADRRQRRRAA